MSHGCRETEGQKGVQQLRYGHWGILESAALISNRLANGSRSQIIQVGHELIRMLGLDPIAVENIFGEVPDVVRDDDPGLCADCCCENVPVLWIWEVQGFDEFFEPGYQAIWNSAIHQLPSSLEAFPGEIWALRQQRSNPLFMNPVSPPRSEKVSQSKAKQQVPERGRIEHACVEDSDE